MAAPPIAERHLPHFHRRAPMKEPVRAATTANITVATDLNNGDTLDGVTLATDDRVLVKDQSTASGNGIYIVGASPARDYDESTDDPSFGWLVYVREGTTNAGTLWANTNTSTPTIGSTSLTFAQFTTGASSLTIKDEGSALATAATSIDFTGAGVTASGTGAAKTVTIPGGGTPSFIGCRLYHSTTQSISNATDTSINFDSEDFDTSAFHFTSAAAITGTVSKTASNTTLTGSSTLFTTELSVNQMLSIPGGGGTDYVVITAIASNTSLTVAVAPLNTASGQTATRFNQGIAVPSGQDGYYHVGARIYYSASNTTGVRWTGIFKNAAHLHGDGNIVLSSSTDGVAGAISDVVSLVAGDYLWANAYQNSTGSINIGGGSDYQRTVFWMFKIGT